MLSEKPWRGEIVMQFIALQFLCFLSGLVAIVLLHKLGVAGFKQETGFGNVLLGTLCFQGATWVLIPIFLRQHEVRWPGPFGLQKNVLGALGWTVAVLVVMLALEYAYEIALQKTGWQPQAQTAVELLMNAPLWPTGIYLGIFAVVIAPVAEEFIFRGVLFPFVRQLGYPRLAWFGVSFLFALVHGDMAIFIPLFALALALTWLYEKTDSLLAPIVVHSLFNAANLALMILANEFSLKLPAQ
jgi:hypothetical protein